MEPLNFKTTHKSTSISFEVPKSRFFAVLSKSKTRTFYLTTPSPIADRMICGNPSTNGIVNDEETSKIELARILAIALSNRYLLLLAPGYVWAFSKYLEAKLDFDTLASLAKIAITLSSYSEIIKPFPSEHTLQIITRINRYYL